MTENTHFDLIIRGGTCIIPRPTSGYTHEVTDLGISAGKIVKIGSLSPSSAKEVIEAKGWHILPGVIDSQVHFRDPGLTHKEDLHSGMKSALLGGVTTIFEMPNTSPSTTTPNDLAKKVDRAMESPWCNFAFFLGAAPENIDSLGDFEKSPGCVGVKVFMGSSTGSLLIEDEDDLFEILKNGQRRVAVHCENEKRLRERFHLAEGSNDPSQHPVWRDEQTAFLATQTLIQAAQRAKRKVHTLHITTRQELEFLAKNKNVATIECLPQHLTLSAPECYERLGTLAQMNPPVRSQEHQEALWRAIENGTVDVVGSDHAPHTLEEKSKPYPKSPAGMPGVQTLLPIMLNHVNQKKLSLDRLVDLVCKNPAQIYGAKRKGQIKEGFDADLTFVDLKKDVTIKREWIASKCGWSPYEGMSVTGWPVGSLIQGKLAMREGEPLGTHGACVEFEHINSI